VDYFVNKCGEYGNSEYLPEESGNSKFSSKVNRDSGCDRDARAEE
jgi:hypothetical protein